MTNVIDRGVSALVLFLVSLIFTPTLAAQDMPIPVDLQHKLIAKIYSFDRSLQGKPGKELRIAIVYQGNLKSSLNTRTALLKETKKLAKDAICDRPVRWLELNLSAGADIKAVAARDSIDIFYICPLRAIEVGDIAAVSREFKIRTCTGIPEYIAVGLAVGLDIKGEKPQIVINLPAAKSEGADFDARLLQLARVVE
jgi:hypothetical protein